MESRVELIMANLYTTLRAIPGVKTVVLEAPRESDTIRPDTLPHVWCWEGAEGPPEHGATNLLNCSLPVSIEVVYRFDDSRQRGLRAEGRRWVAKIQKAVAADVQRGRDEAVNAPIATDTLEQGNAIAETPADGYGVAHLDYAVTYTRHYQNPYGVTP